MNTAKPFSISKQEVFDAYKRVKANKGAAGVDEESIAEFEENLKDNLYKIWNRMSSGSYFPPPVREKEIDKRDGGKRTLGIPTVGDRIAQAVVKAILEPEMDVMFHADSYGYRPKRSALDAVEQARKRCWEFDWVLDMDIKGFFDNIDHDLLMRAVKLHTQERWILLYIERWLTAPMQSEDGRLTAREKGTPQGGVISPLLANLFLHYAFDEWMRRKYPQTRFERYADDVIVHCRTEAEAQILHRAIGARLSACHLDLHPQKTKIVYCKDSNRRGRYEHEKFDFLSYTFRPREAKSRSGSYFTSFSPGISDKARKSVREKIDEWSLYKRSDLTIEDLARWINPIVRGWLQYYGRYYLSELYTIMDQIDQILSRWAMRKYKTLRRRKGKAWGWIRRVKREKPTLFAHWLKDRRKGSLSGAV
jgi:RNA-directed DNA polymerase